MHATYCDTYWESAIINVLSNTCAFPAMTNIYVLGRISAQLTDCYQRVLTCHIANLQPIPLHESLFALTSHSLWMTSSLLLVRFAIFRALDIYSANSVNIVFLQQPSLVWSKPEVTAIAACIYCWFSCEILLSAS